MPFGILQPIQWALGDFILIFLYLQESKSGRRVKNNLNSGIIQQLLDEKWMPKMEDTYEYEDVLEGLIDAVDNEGPVPYDEVCKYLTDIFT